MRAPRHVLRSAACLAALAALTAAAPAPASAQILRTYPLYGCGALVPDSPGPIVEPLPFCTTGTLHVRSLAIAPTVFEVFGTVDGFPGYGTMLNTSAGILPGIGDEVYFYGSHFHGCCGYNFPTYVPLAVGVSALFQTFEGQYFRSAATLNVIPEPTPAALLAATGGLVAAGAAAARARGSRRREAARREAARRA